MLCLNCLLFTFEANGLEVLRIKQVKVSVMLTCCPNASFGIFHTQLAFMCTYVLEIHRLIRPFAYNIETLFKKTF